MTLYLGHVETAIWRALWAASPAAPRPKNGKRPALSAKRSWPSTPALADLLEKLLASLLREVALLVGIAGTAWLKLRTATRMGLPLTACHHGPLPSRISGGHWSCSLILTYSAWTTNLQDKMQYSIYAYLRHKLAHCLERYWERLLSRVGPTLLGSSMI